jgi:acetylornithine deacetylase
LFGFLVSYFCSFYANETLPYNIVIVASAEEENSGKTDCTETFTGIGLCDCREPTLMQLAIAEKDC